MLFSLPFCSAGFRCVMLQVRPSSSERLFLAQDYLRWQDSSACLSPRAPTCGPHKQRAAVCRKHCMFLLQAAQLWAWELSDLDCSDSAAYLFFLKVILVWR